MAGLRRFLNGRALVKVATVLGVVELAVSLAACGGPAEGDKAKQAAPTPTVVVAEVVQKTVPIYSEYVAQTDAKETVEIRARVQAFLEAQHFTEGTIVKKNQLLFTLDKREFEAKLQQAKAELEIAHGATRQGRNRRAPPEAAGRAAGRAAAGLRQRGGESAVRPGRSLCRQVPSVVEAELDLSYTHDPLADRRPDRQAPGGSRQPRRQGRRHAARHRVQHRSDPGQCHRQRSGVPALLRPQESAGRPIPPRSS